MWKSLVFAGVVLIGIGLVDDFIDEDTRPLSRYFGLLFSILMLGLVLSSVGLIGWARRLRSSSQLGMAAMVFLFPWVVIVVGLIIDGEHIRAPISFSGLLQIPATVLAVVLVIMAAVNGT